jgi:hypothetical protein
VEISRRWSCRSLAAEFAVAALDDIGGGGVVFVVVNNEFFMRRRNSGDSFRGFVDS